MGSGGVLELIVFSVAVTSMLVLDSMESLYVCRAAVS